MSRIVITGIGSLINHDDKIVRSGLYRLSNRMTQARLLNDIEKISVVAAGNALADAGIPSPLANDSVSIYAGIDEGIDGIKLRYYKGVLKDGPIGASPALFPFTSPNAVSAQIAIAFDVRGECITFPAGMLSGARAISYASECIMLGKTDIALAGGATRIDEELKEMLKDSGKSDAGKLISGAAFAVLESDEYAKARGAKIYGEMVYNIDMFADGLTVNSILDEVKSECLRESGIRENEIEFIFVIADDAFFFSSHGVKTFNPYSISASFPLLLSDYLTGDSHKGAALFICYDPHGNLSAILVRKSIQ